MQRGHPTLQEQEKIRTDLKQYYLKGISANAAAKDTGFNNKTVLKYYHSWNQEVLENEDDFVDSAKIAKFQTLTELNLQLIDWEKDKEKVETMKERARQAGNLLSFEKLTNMKLKISKQILNIVSARFQLINTPTADVIANMEKQDAS